MDENKVIKKLLERVEKLEKAVFSKGGGKLEVIKRQNFRGATGGLRLLISKGFFSRKKNFGEIKKALADNRYHYSDQAIQTPLNNLSKAGEPLVGFKEGGKKVYAERK